MLSALRRKKLEHEFRSTDFDGSGYLEFCDFEGSMAELCRVQNVSLDSDIYRTRIALVREFWNQLSEFADSNKDGKISVDEYCDFYESLFAGGTPTMENLPPWFSGLCDAYVELLDLNGDGEIGLSEYTTYCAVRHISAEAAAQAFKILDLNGDGGISKDEVRKLAFDFFFSDDPAAPGNNLYGPLK